jgi:AraC-like DNA-binding protein
LARADLRVSEIAFAVGFQSLSQFNRTFKRLAGKSPREYRATANHQNGNGIGP